MAHSQPPQLRKKAKHCTIIPLIILILFEATHLKHQFEIFSVHFASLYSNITSESPKVARVSLEGSSTQRKHPSNHLSKLNSTKKYSLSDSVKIEYDQWYYIVQNLSGIRPLPSNWTPIIVNWTNHPEQRSHRFPTVSERIQYYMGKWHSASLPLYGAQFDRDTYVQRQSTLKYGTFSMISVNLFNLEKHRIFDECYKNKQEDVAISSYCKDYIDIAVLHSEGSANVILFMGDSLPGDVPLVMYSYPIFTKVRPLCCDEEAAYSSCTPRSSHVDGFCSNEERLAPIILPLNRQRHFQLPSEVPANDIPWEQKKVMAIWRGKYAKVDEFRGTLTSKQMKYALVTKSLNSSLVDAKFSPGDHDAPTSMIGSFMNISDQLQYKYIISIEGNDVSSGLKWMLFSNSVVLAPPFTWESWAMEGKLKPFVHYLPIKEDMSNVEEVIRWAEQHPEQTRLISERSTLFIYDMLFHPDAIKDEKLIMQGIMERYEENFGQWKVTQNIKMKWQYDENSTDRALRFPSVDERFKYYIGNWSHKRNESISMNRGNIEQLSMLFPNRGISKNVPFIASGKNLSQCVIDSSTHSKEIRKLCEEALPAFDERTTAHLKPNFFDKLMNSTGKNLRFAPHSSWLGEIGNEMFQRVLLDDSIKVINFGSTKGENKSLVPIFSMARESNGNSHSDVILWPFGLSDFYDLTGWVETVDISFTSKQSKAIWRNGLGTSSKNLQHSLEFLHRQDLVNKSSTEEKKFIDAKFILSNNLKKDLLNIKLSNIDKKLDRKKHIQMMLSYRYLIVTEDEDSFNSDLIWMLLSNSVVFMAKPRWESWIMESKLKPFIHYVPIKEDMSDVKDMVQWAEDNLQQTRLISLQSTWFVHDLLLHPDSHRDNLLIKDMIMEAYQQNV